MKIKICGLTRLSDALLAEKLGADIAGFIFAESKRRISVMAAAKITAKLKRIKKAGVFVNEKPERVNAAVKAAGLDYVQLHGSESPAYIGKIRGAEVIKAISVKNASYVRKQSRKYAPHAAYLLFDTYSRKARGGTGKRFNAATLKKAGKIKAKCFVAGGVNPGNAAEIIKALRPYGLDASSGIERSPGVKDAAKMRKLFREIKRSAKVKK